MVPLQSTSLVTNLFFQLETSDFETQSTTSLAFLTRTTRTGMLE